VGKGDTTMVWKDIWNFGSLQQLYPHLFSYTKEPNCSVSRFLNLLPDYNRLFHLPLSIAASHQLAELLDSLEEWNRETNSKETFYAQGYLLWTEPKWFFDCFTSSLCKTFLWASQDQSKWKYILLGPTCYFVIPRSEKEGTKPPYVCPGCSNHTHGNNMINRCNVIK
jgi:hypothetical protein